VLDGIKKAAGAVSNWAGTTGHNLTTNITADKLQSAWKQAGSPTDSEQIKQILTNAGVDAGVIDKAFTDMGIPTATVTPSQTANKVGDTATSDTGIAKATVPSNQTVNIDDIVARIKKLAPADQQQVLAFLQAK
jgi:ribosomal protein L12E/L44/L45/RPP1/RPP2